MPLNETFTGIIEKLTQRIDELKAQMDALDTKSTTAYNTSVSLADAIKAQAEALKALKTRVDNIENTRSVTTTLRLLLTVQDFPVLSFSTQSLKQSTKIMFTFIRGIENECNLQ